jgi:superfamily II DNA or RNA helicase
MQLRPYQEDACDKVVAAFGEYRKVLGVAATGAGKTIIFSALTARSEGRVLIIAHREELIQQAVDKLRSSTGVVAEVERADQRASLDARVVVASIQTLCRRFSRFPQNHFSLGIVDECHHVMADSYQGPLNYFLEGGMRVLGVTATPGTKGKKALGNFFEEIAFEIPLIELIRAGYLSPITVKSFPLHADIPLVMKGGDYDQDAIDHALGPYLENIVARLAPELGDRKTIVFLPLIKTVERFVDLCRKHGLTAEGISGESEDRKAILDGHGTRFQILANSMLLTEGYDDPGIDAMMILRPTRSEILFSQMVGRGTRIFCPWGCKQRCQHNSRKKNLLLLDPLWLHEDMNLVRPAHLVCEREDDRRTVAERVADAQAELDLLELKANAEHEREKALAEKIAKLEKRKAKVISIEEWAVMTHNPNVAEYEPTMGWHEKPISPKQREFLERQGFDVSSIRGRGHASALMDNIFRRIKSGLATARQMKLLRQFKHPNPETVTKDEAVKWLDEQFARRRSKAHSPAH